MLNPYYVTGFTEGEGSFYVSVSPRKLEKVQWEIRPTFSISQNKDNRGILYQIRDFFGCGSVRPSKRDNTYRYEVRALNDISEKIIPHFKKYPLITEGKKNDFEALCRVVEIMLQKRHLTEEGLKDIFQILLSARPESRRNYNIKELSRLMKV